MKYTLLALILLIQTAIHAMEIEPTKFTVNEDSILHELNKISHYNDPWQYCYLHKTFGNLVSTLFSLKILNGLEKKYPKKRTHTAKTLWQEEGFYHWLRWYENALRIAILDLTKSERYYERYQTIFHDAITAKNHLLLRFTLHIGIKPSSCMYSTLNGVSDKKIAQLLINHGENINRIGHHNMNVIMMPLSAALLRFYLKKNININYTNESGNALYWLIARYSRENPEEIKQNIQLLINAGININHINKSNKTVLDNTLEQINIWNVFPEYQKPYKELELLLRNNGALTAEEINQIRSENEQCLV